MNDKALRERLDYLRRFRARYAKYWERMPRRVPEYILDADQVIELLEEVLALRAEVALLRRAMGAMEAQFVFKAETEKAEVVA